MSPCIVFIMQMFLAMFQVLAYLRTIGTLVFTVSSGTLIAFAVRYLIKCLYPKEMVDDPDLKDGWFGKGPRPLDSVDKDETIRPFEIKIDEDVLEDLKQRLARTRFDEPVEDAKFTYGFNMTYLRQLVKYWKDEYDWRKHEAELNKLPHFKTTIEGIDVHFVHVKPEVVKDNVRVIPLMIIHGWPGCFAEFYKIVPLLTAQNQSRDFVFEVVCPSIPGYGFSEAPHKSGMTNRAAGRIFVKLMKRIGHDRFYVQGGDWGSIVATNMAKFYPKTVRGLHINMFGMLSPLELLKFLLLAVFPFVLSKEEYKLCYPLGRKLRFMFRETGYYHMQATKPDTLGCGMTDSPAGMAAYLLEKFAVATNVQYLKRDDGGLTEKFTMDELLTICTVYWVTKTFTSAARFYKENNRDALKFTNYPVNVPTGVAAFPNEVLMYPQTMLTHQLRNIVSYKVMPKGGHFAALEEPHIFARDVWDFVEQAERGTRRKR